MNFEHYFLNWPWYVKIYSLKLLVKNFLAIFYVILYIIISQHGKLFFGRQNLYFILKSFLRYFGFILIGNFLITGAGLLYMICASMDHIRLIRFVQIQLLS